MNETEEKGVHKTEREMPFLEHLEELRWRLIKSLSAIVVAAIGAYFFSDQLLAILIGPYNDAFNYLGKPVGQKLIFLTPTGGFMIHVKLAVFAGLLIALPVVFYQIWRFVVPGLMNKERRHVPIIVALSTICFFAGAFFCYFVVLKFGLRFLLGFETADLAANITISDYLQFITMLILVFGMVFELPILAFFLTKIGLVTPAFLRHYRRHAIVLMVILSAIITPPDVFTQILLAGPLALLYEISILVSVLALKQQA